MLAGDNARAVDILAGRAGFSLGVAERNGDEARIGIGSGHVGLTDDAAPAAPAVERAARKVLGAACCLTGAAAFVGGFGEFVDDRRSWGELS